MVGCVAVLTASVGPLKTACSTASVSKLSQQRKPASGNGAVGVSSSTMIGPSMPGDDVGPETPLQLGMELLGASQADS